MSGGSDPYRARLCTLQEMDEDVLPRAGRVSLTTEDVILLLLRAGSRPIRGKTALTAQVLLAVSGPLAGSGVEPIVFRRKGPAQQPRSDHVERALDHLAFTKNVAVATGRRGASSEIAITPRGRGRIAEKHRRLPRAARDALARQRFEWGGSAPECGMGIGTYVHNRELLEHLSTRGGTGRDRRVT